MICYTLRCENGHDFDSWFQSAGAFDSLSASGHVGCAVCGSAKVNKAPMASAVRTQPTRPLTADPTPQETALADLRRKVEENSEYVGMAFAAEARAIHDGDAPERPIYGEAKPADALKLLEDGVPVAPLPFLPARKVN